MVYVTMLENEKELLIQIKNPAEYVSQEELTKFEKTQKGETRCLHGIPEACEDHFWKNL